jgi:general secretion pathway protein C
VSQPIPGRPAQAETGISIPKVRKGTLLDLLGLETGDQLLRINHLDVRSPEQALRAYALLRHADHLVVEVRRGDRIIELVYRII